MNFSDVINLEMAKSPINWVIIWLVLAFAGVALALLASQSSTGN